MSALLYYTEIYLGCKFFIEIFYKLKGFTCTVILVFHLACVEIVTWIEIHYVFSALLGSIVCTLYN